ncbi:MAG: hypothetical protein GY866_02555 [Proteobacteria bacterium]|nr:hypothetical protein [Pseudomonadota bacterium]
MDQYNFYEIKSKKSSIFVEGVRQVSLVCADYADFHFFLWLNESHELQHLQFLFNEKIIEWFAGKEELALSQTNRATTPPTKTGIHKGVRTIHGAQDDSILEEGRKIVEHSNFPTHYDKLIRNRIV